MIINQSDDDENKFNDDSVLSSNLNEIPTPNARGRPQKLIMVHFQPKHIEAPTHCSSIRPSDKIFIPVPIGPSLPRCDRDEVKARYCCLMLILFKPWRHTNDLQLLGQSWEVAFSEFLKQCSLGFKTKIKNMQLLHECHDSGCDHFCRSLKEKSQGSMSFQ